MELANTRTAKAKLSEYINSLETRGPIIITSNSKPKALLISFSEDDLASLVIQNSKEIHDAVMELSLIHISEPTRLGMISYAVFCLKKKKTKAKIPE